MNDDAPATDGPGRPQTNEPDTGATAPRIAPARAPGEHGGPYHELPDKRTLAIHLGVPHHIGASVLRIAYPSAAVRSRWRLDDLRAEHRSMHEEPTE